MLEKISNLITLLLFENLHKGKYTIQLVMKVIKLSQIHSQEQKLNQQIKIK